MKVNELSRLTHVNSETIRMYRCRKLLFPQRCLQNGYYEYSETDLLALLHVRKLRGANLSLDTIADTYQNGDTSAIVRNYRGELEMLEREVTRLRQRQEMLQLTLDHLEACRDSGEPVQLIEAYGEKYDAYFPARTSDAADPAFDTWVQNMELFTETLCITKEDMLSDAPRLPVRIGLGSYLSVLKRSHLPIPAGAAFFPKGTYAAAYITLSDIHSIAREQVKPLLDYIEAQQLVLDGDTTAFLFRIDASGPLPQFVFRLRVRVRPKSET